VHDSVEVPAPPTMLVGVRVQTRFVESVVAARVTVPANPFSGETVMVELAVTPALTVILVGLAVAVKS
jgi:hypothetical protein